MNLVKRIEIIADEQEMHRILAGLEEIGVPGYTVIHNVTGKTPRATMADDLPISGLGNVYLICFCSEAMAAKITSTILPILNKLGGVCYLSDAVSIKEG
ncbi:MAG: P-II family nitrogen regulator [Prochlorotrichaceae cyanobacterium]|jgi:nitrogen regulatory protein PII